MIFRNLGIPECLVLFFIIGIFALWFFALVDALKSNFSDSTTKLIWVLLIIFVPALGATLYLIIGRGQKIGDTS